MSSLSTIDFNELPNDVLKQIPLSIRTKKSIYNINELPIEVQYIIEKYYNFKPPEIDYPNMLDAKFDISVYSDLGIHNDPVQLFLDYFSNYLKIRQGSYPFDVDFGSTIKEHIHTKDTSLRQTLLSNELSNMAGVLGNDYNLDVKVVNYKLMPVQSYDRAEYYMELTLSVDGENFTIVS